MQAAFLELDRELTKPALADQRRFAAAMLPGIFMLEK